MEKVASWSSPVLRAAVVEVMDGLQQSWRLAATNHRQRRLEPSQTSFFTPTRFVNFTLGIVAISLFLTHLQTVLLILVTLVLSFAFLRQLQQGLRQGRTRQPILLPVLVPVLISLGALLGSANLGVAAPWLLVVLLAQVILVVVQTPPAASADLAWADLTWTGLLQTLAQGQPLQQLVALETLRQQARQGQLDPTQRQVLRQALQLLLNEQITAEVRQAILTALPQLAPRHSLRHYQ